jgi:hypothetical protein
MDEAGILLRVLAQFAKFALGHESKFSGRRFAQQVLYKPGHAASRQARGVPRVNIRWL